MPHTCLLGEVFYDWGKAKRHLQMEALVVPAPDKDSGNPYLMLPAGNQL